MAKNIDHVLHKKSNQVLSNDKPKAPTSGSVEYGEIAVNYAAGKETFFIKNSNDEVVPFARVTVEDMARWDTAASGGINSVDPSGMSASITGNTLVINTNASKVKLDDFTHDAQNSTSAYTNESAVTSSADYDSIITSGASGFSGVSINNALSVLEREIINVWKILGKKDWDKDYYGTSVYDIIMEDERVTAEALNNMNNRITALAEDVSDLSDRLNALIQRVDNMALTISASLNDLNSRICSQAT